MAFDKAAQLRFSRWQSQLVKIWGEPISWFTFDDASTKDVILAYYQLDELHVYLSYGLSELSISAHRHELILVTDQHHEGWAHFIADAVTALATAPELLGAMLSFNEPAVNGCVSSAAVVTPYRKFIGNDLPIFKMLMFKLSYFSLLPLHQDELPLISKSGTDKFYQFLADNATNATRGSLAYMLG